MTETYLAQAVAATDEASTYDTNVKFLLADKQILAWILKYAVREFQDMGIRDIIPHIGDDIEVGTRPVDPGLSNLGRVRENSTEDSVPGEGSIFYDIRFSAYHRGREMKFLVNVEAQRSTDPGKLGYHLENRIVYYLARLVSAQKQTEFFHSDFDSLKRVRSIWICMDREEDGDSIEEIGLVRRVTFGSGVELEEGSLRQKEAFGEASEPEAVELMKGIIIHVRSGENLAESQNALISMLEKLFSRMGAEEKKRVLTEKYGMVMTTELERRTQIMCNLSQNIIEEGIERGIEQGIEQGMERHLIKLIQIKIGKGKPVSQIAEELEETVEQIEAMIEKMQHSPETE